MSDRRRRLFGRVCLWAGVIGALQAVVLAIVPAQVDKARFSYPFDVTGHTVAQTSFFVQHLGLLAGMVALCCIPAARLTRSTRWGLRAGTAGMGLLAVMELIAIAPANEPLSSDLATTVNGIYSVPVLLIGFGMTIGGVGLARQTEPTTPGWLRWIPTAVGVWVFAPLSPALMGPFVAGRAAIGSWMLLFVALGWGLMQESHPAWNLRADAAADRSVAPAAASQRAAN